MSSWIGNPGAGSLHAIRRSVEDPGSGIGFEELSHGGMVAPYIAGAARMPFYPVAAYAGSDVPAAIRTIRRIADPFGGPDVHVVPPLTPDFSIIDVERADASGNAQLWGIQGMQREAAFASSSSDGRGVR